MVKKSTPAAQLIAYMSLCMLAAAFGATVGPTWTRWWAIFGAFGLASAIGLDVLNRSRARIEDRRSKQRIARKVERNLGKMMDTMESSGAIRAALRRFQPDAADPGPRSSDVPLDPRVPLDKPVTITRLRQFSAGVEDRLGKPVKGRVRNISRYGVGLTHDQRLERGPVLLEFELDDGKPLGFIAEVLWCELRECGSYSSGGKLLELVGPNDAPQPAIVGAG